MTNQGGIRGGFHFGNVGGDVKLEAQGDIVGGDKTTTSGFAAEEQKQSFQSDLDTLRELLRQLKAQLEGSSDLSADDKDELGRELLEHVKALKDVKAATAEVPPGKEPPPATVTRVEATLEKAGCIFDRLQGVAQKSASLAATVAEFAKTYGPLLLSARHLFGLP